MLILGVDTSSQTTSLSVLAGGRLAGSFEHTYRHPPSDTVFPALRDLLDRTGHHPRDFDAFAACVGPGSFTGLRIGLGMVKTFAFALGRPVVGVDALEVAARRAAAVHGIADGELITVVVPGFKAITFSGRFVRSGGGVTAAGELAHHDGADELAAAVAGAGKVYVPETHAELVPAALPVAAGESAATLVARAAAERIDADEVPAAADVQPLYLKPFSIGRKAKTAEDLR